MSGWPVELYDSWKPAGNYGDERILSRLPQHKRLLLWKYDDQELIGNQLSDRDKEIKDAIESYLQQEELKDQLDTLEKFYIYKKLKEMVDDDSGLHENYYLNDYDEELPVIIDTKEYKQYRKDWNHNIDNLQDKFRKAVASAEFDNYLDFIRVNPEWEMEIGQAKPELPTSVPAEEEGRGFRRKRKTRKMRRRQRQVSNRRHSRMKRQSRRNLNKKLRRSAARHSRRRTRSNARHNRRRTLSAARRSNARHSRRRTRSKARRSATLKNLR